MRGGRVVNKIYFGGGSFLTLVWSTQRSPSERMRCQYKFFLLAIHHDNSVKIKHIKKEILDQMWLTLCILFQSFHLFRFLAWIAKKYHQHLVFKVYYENQQMSGLILICQERGRETEERERQGESNFVFVIVKNTQQTQENLLIILVAIFPRRQQFANFYCFLYPLGYDL